MKKAGILILATLALAACSKENKTNTMDKAQLNAASQEDLPPLKMEDVKEGIGMAVQNNMKIAVHYIGKLSDGTQFDSSRDRGNPFIFTVGIGMVIPGWDQGIVGMKPGGVRKLTIPPHLAYGAQQIGKLIPPNSTLEFEVELLEIFQ